MSESKREFINQRKNVRKNRIDLLNARELKLINFVKRDIIKQMNLVNQI